MLKHCILAVSLLLTLGTTQAAPNKTAVFAGGCFWCVEALFQELKGVDEAVSGFIGGTLKNPTYRGNHKGHYEAVSVTYDPDIISYQNLLDIFWVNIDPFDARGQFCDKGPSYLSAIFVNDDAERQAAQASKAAIEKRFPEQQIVMPILASSQFWPIAGKEAYHQDYYLTHKYRYKFYRGRCGRDDRLEEVWQGAKSLSTPSK